MEMEIIDQCKKCKILVLFDLLSITGECISCIQESKCECCTRFHSNNKYPLCDKCGGCSHVCLWKMPSWPMARPCIRWYRFFESTESVSWTKSRWLNQDVQYCCIKNVGRSLTDVFWIFLGADTCIMYVYDITVTYIHFFLGACMYVYDIIVTFF